MVSLFCDFPVFHRSKHGTFGFMGVLTVVKLAMVEVRAHFREILTDFLGLEINHAKIANTRGIDDLSAIGEGKHLSKSGGWHMKAKHEDITDSDMFYCFVDLGDKDSSVFVVPAKKVAQAIRSSHTVWLKTPGKNGQAHNDNVMRWITSKYPWDVPGLKTNWMDNYLEAWELLS